jgi:hypothetical protein
MSTIQKSSRKQHPLLREILFGLGLAWWLGHQAPGYAVGSREYRAQAIGPNPIPSPASTRKAPEGQQQGGSDRV